MDNIKKLTKKVKKMELGNPLITTLVGLIIFYIGLKTFSGGMKSMGNMDHLQFFLGNPMYMFIGGIAMTLLWQSSSLSTTAIIALVASGALPLPAAIACVLGANIGTTITAVLASFAVDDPAGLTIALHHVFFNLMGVAIIYPFKAIRNIPVNLAKSLSNITAKRRYIAILYVLITFLLLPLLGVVLFN